LLEEVLKMEDLSISLLQRELDLDELDIHWPKSSKEAQDRHAIADHTNVSPSSVKNMYAESDLSALPLFAGGWINYGIWDNIDYRNPKLLTEKDRIKSSQNMYEHVFSKLEINSYSEVLEIGCGLGMGGALLANNYPVKRIVGIDITEEQIRRALRQQQATRIIHGKKLEFLIGAAEKLNFPNQTFSHVISVECAQHIRPLYSFLSESLRVLKPFGSLVFTIVLAKDKQSLRKLQTIIPDYEIHMSDLTLPEVETSVISLYHNVKIEKIGQQVWEGLDAWLIRQNMEKQWSRIWLKAYQLGWIDYYVIWARAGTTD
jgi:cyclopropane fatty-acyl-phospholipid synthase-like methyltransferase